VTFGRYALVVVSILAVTLVGASALLGGRLTSWELWAVVFGGAVAASNALLAHALALRSRGRSVGVFLKLVLGGMAARMVLVLAAVLVAVLALDLSPAPLVVSLIGHFAVFLALEIYAVNALNGTVAEAR
jgi:hypothetical protein